MLFLLLLQYLPSVLHVTEYLRDLYVQHPGEGKVNEQFKWRENAQEIHKGRHARQHASKK